MTIDICLAGATGWAGSALARAIAHTDDLRLRAAVSRAYAGKKLSNVLNEPSLDCPIFASAAEALTIPCDVFMDYTHPDAAKANILTALQHGANVVVGTSGLSDADYAEIGAASNAAGRGVLAVGNFALTVVLLQKFAEMAARVLPQWEIIDYASDAKIDAPSGTVNELANRLSNVRPSALTVALEETRGVPGTRGARLGGTQVHSVRLPGYSISVEVLFGLPDQKLTLRHDAGSSAAPYVDGALLAIRKVGTFSGLRRGLDSVLEF
jgi:4-hydroxy-tetrahydrodipicolinate reductase